MRQSISLTRLPFPLVQSTSTGLLSARVASSTNRNMFDPLPFAISFCASIIWDTRSALVVTVATLKFGIPNARLCAPTRAAKAAGAFSKKPHGQALGYNSPHRRQWIKSSPKLRASTRRCALRALSRARARRRDPVPERPKPPAHSAKNHTARRSATLPRTAANG